MIKCVVILSGGMDSTTLVSHMMSLSYDVHLLSFNYGQRHSKELAAAAATAKRLRLPHKIVDLRCLTPLIDNSALTGNIEVPEGHYADDNMKKTVVPNRNMIMLSIAAGYAINIGARIVAYGAHSGDHTIYPDCRPEFLAAMGHAFGLCDFTPLTIFAPFMDIDKGDIALLGKQLGVHYEDTWTCYKGLDDPCGVCGACVERAEAFLKADMRDPLVKEVQLELPNV